jgi:predicted ATPase
MSSPLGGGENDLSRSEAELGRWRDARCEALGPNGQLMVNLVPELDLVIGKQAPVPDSPLQDAQNRFQMVFWRFLGVFARQDHPLAVNPVSPRPNKFGRADGNYVLTNRRAAGCRA